MKITKLQMNPTPTDIVAIYDYSVKLDGKIIRWHVIANYKSDEDRDGYVLDSDISAQPNDSDTVMDKEMLKAQRLIEMDAKKYLPITGLKFIL